MREIKYLVCPGIVRSTHDGDFHKISAPQLMELYKVNPEECKVVNDREDTFGLDWSKYIVLRPKTNGDYTLPSN